MTPKQIIDFSKKNPAALEQLIASFGYECYRSAIDDMTRSFADAATCSIPELGCTSILISDQYLKNWKSGNMCKWKEQLPKKEEKQPEEYFSNCCGVSVNPDYFFEEGERCPKCKDHCSIVVEQDAAPDMYEALQNIVEMTDNNRTDWHLRLFDIQKKAKAALAKADGVLKNNSWRSI